jgi:hypothetical protein
VWGVYVASEIRNDVLKLEALKDQHLEQELIGGSGF